MIAWLDVETTGLDPAAGHLLEVGVILTDDELVEQHRNRIVIMPPSGAVVVMNEAVKSMHEDNGLWAEARAHGTPLFKADITMSEWVEHLCDEPPVMAGSTIGFDRKWLEAHMPRLAKQFHYRSIDVSSIKELNRRLKFAAEWNSGRKTHRALDDLEDSIRELRWYLFELGLVDENPLDDRCDGMSAPESSEGALEEARKRAAELQDRIVGLLPNGAFSRTVQAFSEEACIVDAGLLDSLTERLRKAEGLLLTAADALHDAAWVMSGRAKESPPLPSPVSIVLPQTERVEAEIRAALTDYDERKGGPE